jgi:hypothetical protein
MRLVLAGLALALSVETSVHTAAAANYHRYLVEYDAS